MSEPKIGIEVAPTVKWLGFQGDLAMPVGRFFESTEWQLEGGLEVCPTAELASHLKTTLRALVKKVI